MSKDDVLSVRWSKREKDFLVRYPRKCDGHLVHGKLLADTIEHDFGSGKYKMFNLIDELELRGYDTKTLVFSVRLRPIEGGRDE